MSSPFLTSLSTFGSRINHWRLSTNIDRNRIGSESRLVSWSRANREGIFLALELGVFLVGDEELERRFRRGVEGGTSDSLGGRGSRSLPGCASTSMGSSASTSKVTREDDARGVESLFVVSGDIEADGVGSISFARFVLGVSITVSPVSISSSSSSIRLLKATFRLPGVACSGVKMEDPRLRADLVGEIGRCNLVGVGVGTKLVGSFVGDLLCCRRSFCC